MKLSNHSYVTRIVAVMLVTAVVVSAAPAMASVIGEARGTTVSAVFSATLTPAKAPVNVAEKISLVSSDAARFTQATSRATRVKAPMPRPVNTWTRTAAPSSTDRAAATAAAIQNTSVPQPPAPAASADAKLAEARAILARYAATYKYVSGTTIEYGNTQGNAQAIVYYKSKRIVLNPNFTRNLETIIGHEIWHIIDYHHNGQINWGEQVPPSNANDFRL